MEGILTSTMADFVKDPSIQEPLRSRGVDLARLDQELAGLTLRECARSPDFLSTPAGRQFSKQMVSPSQRPELGRLIFLLECLVTRGPASQPLERCGVTESLLRELLSAPDEAP